jgi:tetratricopeptide (TPR) repeat protein
LALLAALLVVAGSVVVRVVAGRDEAQDVLSGLPPPSPVELSAESMVARLRDDLRRNPENTYAYAQLGLALLQRMRETADASLYAQAEMAFAEALERDPRQLDALIGQGILALARHDFDGALRWAEQARALNPYRAQILGIMVDAQIELGRYDEAVAAAQAMVDLRPDLTSYSRVSYLRELHGDTAGAIEAMQAAVDAGMPATEGWLWVQTQLGHLYFNSGDWRKAEETYREALRFRSDYAYAAAGLARVQAARGNYADAIEGYQTVAARLPLPEFVIPLGELYQLTGQEAEAARQYELVRAIQKLNASAGVDVDLELALFDVDHGGDPAQALERARAAYARRPSLHAADVLAWALYKAGEYHEAQLFAQEALRLGTQDALMLFHAGMIAHRLGHPDQARDYLERALTINPSFSLLYADEARRTLEALSAAPAETTRPNRPSPPKIPPQ